MKILLWLHIRSVQVCMMLYWMHAVVMDLNLKLDKVPHKLYRLFQLVAANLGVSLVPASAMQLGIKGVQYLQVAELKP